MCLMVKSILFENGLPKVFIGSPPEGGPSDVWGCNLLFEKGCSVLIESASGRGKSSFCSFVYGLRNDYVGNICLMNDAGEMLPHTSEVSCELRRRGIAMMFQELRLFPELTAVENVMLKNSITSLFDENDVRGMLCELGLEARLDVPCAILSFGQLQRVAFVRMLAQPADFYLFDEPVSHLDEENSIKMGRMLRERQCKDGAGVIVTSIGRRLAYDFDTVLRL